MIVQHELRRNGPYLSVIVPEMEADWDTLRRDIALELQEGVTRVTLLVPPPADLDDERGLSSVLDELTANGVESSVQRR